MALTEVGIKTKAYVDCCKHYGGGDNAFGYLMISIRENRYCLNVAREHCSNGIYFIIDIASLTFTQRCHACKSFCSEFFILPEHHLRATVNQALATKRSDEVVKESSIE